MELSEDDVLHILKLIDESKFDYFQLEVGELKITVSKGDPIPIAGAAQPAPASVAPTSGGRSGKTRSDNQHCAGRASSQAGDDSRRYVADHSTVARNILCCPGTGRSAVRQSRPADHRGYYRRIDRSDESFQQRARHR